MSELLVRKAIPSDAPRLLEINDAAWLATYPVNKDGLVITTEDILSRLNANPKEVRIENWMKRVSEMDDKTITSYVCEVEGNVVGYCVLMQNGTEFRIKQMYVLPDNHREGIGTALMNEGLKWLHANENDVIVEVASYNEKALNFYGKFGFKITREVTDPIGQLPSGAVIPEVEMIRQAGEIV